MRRTAAAAAETRRALINEAVLEFADHGFEGTSFERVAARVGLTRGAVHHHFPGGKNELLEAVLTEQWAVYGDRVLAPLQEPGQPGAARLRAFLTGYLDLIVADPMFQALATVTTLVAPRTGPVGLDGHRQSLDGWRSVLRSVLAEPGVLVSHIPVDAGVTAVVSFLLGINTTAAIEPEQLPATPRHRRAITDAVLGGMLAAAAPAASAQAAAEE